MSRYLHDLLTAAKVVERQPPELRQAIEAVEQHLNDSRRQNILGLARATLACEGELEFDDDAVVSEGDDNGAYLQAWVWVDFGGTGLDKNQPPGSLQGTPPNEHQR